MKKIKNVAEAEETTSIMSSLDAVLEASRAAQSELTDIVEDLGSRDFLNRQIKKANQEHMARQAADISDEQKAIELDELSKAITPKREAGECYCVEYKKERELTSDMRLSSSWPRYRAYIQKSCICSVCFDKSGFDPDFANDCARALSSEGGFKL